MDTVQMRSRDFLIPGYPGTRISRRYPYFRPQLPITSHLLSIYYIQHAKICDGLTTFNALLSDRKQKNKNKMPTVSSFFARVFLTTYYFLLRISSLPNLRTPAQKQTRKRRKKPPTRQQLLIQNVHLSSVVFEDFFCCYYRQWKYVYGKLKTKQKELLLKNQFCSFKSMDMVPIKHPVLNFPASLY